MTPRFAALFARQVLRPALRHPLLPALNVACIAAGITVFLAIQIANRAALDSFRNAVSLVAGRANLEVRGDLPEHVLPAVAAVPGVVVATPLVEGIVTLRDRPGEYLRILGVDPFTGADMRVFQLDAQGGGTLDLESWLRNPRAIAVSPDVGPGTLDVIANGKPATLVPEFVLRADDVAVRADRRLAAMDIAWAQELLGLDKRLTSIQIMVSDPLHAEDVARLIAHVVPADATVGPPARRGAETERMLAAFQLNLSALSLVSVVVGTFLIYNSMSATVVRRRVEIGMLRAVGATRLEVAALFLGEALTAAFLGSLLGILLAGPLAALLSGPMEQTISSLYAVLRVDRLQVDAGQVVLALAIGSGAALMAAARPAMEAAGCAPAGVLHAGSAMEAFPNRAAWCAPAGVAALVASLLASFWALAGGASVLGFISVGLLIAGCALLVPAMTVLFARLLPKPGWLVRLASQHLVRSLHRNAVTIAALSVAAGMTVSVSVMIHSFRASVGAWVGRTLVADLFIAPAANEVVGLQTFMPADAVSWAQGDPRVRETATFREQIISCDGHPASVGIIQGHARGELEFLRSVADASRVFLQPDHAVVSESYATRHGTKPGDTLELTTPSGPRAFTVAGVIRDFTRDSGLILIERGNYERYWQDERVHSLALKLEDPSRAQEVAEDFRARFSRDGEFSIYTNAGLRARVFEIFDQTFAVTSVLRAIAIVVAVAGVFLSLATLVIERTREIGVLRAIGASRPQVRGLILAEAGMIGVLASLVGVACGSAMAMILTWVINKAFFGWTIDLRYPLDVLAGTPLWLVPAAIAAAWIPAARASRVLPAEAVRCE